MNRQQRRAEEAKAKMARNAARIRDVVDEATILANEADRMKQLLFAIAREHGRIRVRFSQLQALTENCRVDFIRCENGDVIVDYKQGAAS